MNDLQKVELELLKQLLVVCEKLDLTYYLVCGSALGAAKYEGFIPWDDDIDVALPRPDYEIFLQKAQSLLPEWCFVQNYRTDPEFHLIGTKLRDSRTTYVEGMCEKLQINHGVFIDVFPLDAYLEEKNAFRHFRRMQKRFEAQRRVRLSYRRFTSRQIFCIRNNWYYLLFRCFGAYRDTAACMRVYEKCIASGDFQNSNILCNHANSISPVEYAPKEQYGQGIMMKFEGLDVRVPSQYDAYLSQKYGNWQEDIPIEQQIGHHIPVICDLTRSYVVYEKRSPSGKVTYKV